MFVADGACEVDLLRRLVELVVQRHAFNYVQHVAVSIAHGGPVGEVVVVVERDRPIRLVPFEAARWRCTCHIALDLERLVGLNRLGIAYLYVRKLVGPSFLGDDVECGKRFVGAQIALYQAADVYVAQVGLIGVGHSQIAHATVAAV